MCEFPKESQTRDNNLLSSVEIGEMDQLSPILIKTVDTKKNSLAKKYCKSKSKQYFSYILKLYYYTKYALC